MKAYRWLLTVIVLALMAGAGCRSARPVPDADARYGRDNRRSTGLPVQTPTLELSRNSESRSADTRFADRASERGGPTAYRLKPGDPVAVYLRGIPREEMIEDIIDEDGFISLPFINRVHAADKTTSELERDIRRKYLEEKIYRDITVNIVSSSQSYYVRGEVLQPGRYKLTSGLTVVRALAAAGGYTEFANPRKVKILRGGKAFYVNLRELEQYPDRDIEIKPGDVMVVPRSMF